MRGLASLMLGIALCTPSAEASADEGPPANRTEFSAGYQFLRDPRAWSGWNASLSIPLGNKGFSWVVDGGSLYTQEGSLRLLTTGPRFSYRATKDVTLFAQVLAGGAWFDADFAAPIAYPGGGIDFRPDETLGFRAQVDWPMLTPYGVATGDPRVSGGIVLRPWRR